MARIAVIGAALQDIYLIDHDDLEPTRIGGEAILGKLLVGSKVDIDKLAYEVGGGGLNVAVGLSRTRHEVILMSNIGDDSAGEAVMRVLDREEIDNSYINYIGNKATGTSIILLDSRGGERTILTYRGASGNFKNIAAGDLELIQPDWLYITTMHGDFETLRAIIDKARKLGIKIMFNPGTNEIKDVAKLLKMLAMVDVVLLNKVEAAGLVPGNILSELLYHLSGYAPITIITDGPMGGIAGNRETGETYRFGIYEDVKIRDATGAGDAFGAGFLGAWASGKSFRQALIFASANSTAVISRIGGNQGTLTGQEDLHPMPIQKVN
ncbi:carbohydrate kinase family protein [Candidatus Saccharibacteria bacterium]|nr:carbohydrate kinase family protein [Candidatus Saccharibacteria bacterium]